MDDNFLTKSKLIADPFSLNERIHWFLYLDDFYKYLLLYQMGKECNSFYKKHNPFPNIKKYYKRSNKNLKLIKSRLKNIKRKLKAVKKICPFCGEFRTLDNFDFGCCYCKCNICISNENDIN